MIAITDTTAFAELELVTTQADYVIPSAIEINTLIGPTEFVNADITTAFRVLLSTITNECIHPITGEYLQSDTILLRASQMFNRVGFYIEDDTMQFIANTDALDAGTRDIIDRVHELETFQEIAYNAFHDNSWAQEANNVRALPNSGLQKIHTISVFNNSDLDAGQGSEDEDNLLNSTNKDTERFLLISHDANDDQVMPAVRIYNNSDAAVRLRIKVLYEKYVTNAANYLGGFGPAVPYDLNNNGVTTAAENIYLNRRFLDYFPNQANADNVEGEIYTVLIDPQQSWDINYDDRIRGGEAQIQFLTGTDTAGDWDDGELHTFTYHIRGENPTYEQVNTYLEDSGYLDRFWFMVRKIRQETGSYGANDTDNDFEFRHFNPASANANFDYDVRKNHGYGLPNFGPPRGFGLGQIDNFGDATAAEVPVPPAIGDTIVVQVTENGVLVDRTVDFSRRKVASDQEVWNWKENIDASIGLLETKITELSTSRTPDFPGLSVEDMFNQISDWNTANPTNQVDEEDIGDQTEPPTIEIPGAGIDRITFSFVETEIEGLEDYNAMFGGETAANDNVKSFLDACLLKAYNGYGTGTQRNYFYSQQSGVLKPTLHVLRSAIVGGDTTFYVREVCRRND